MEIRLMTMGDYPAALALWRETLRVLPDDEEAGIARYLARNPETCFVAADGDGLVGTVLCGHDGRRGYIYHMAVAQEARLRGVGRLLAQAAREALVRAGIQKAALLVFRDNEGGDAFWAAQGYVTREDLVYREQYIGEA